MVSLSSIPGLTDSFVNTSIGPVFVRIGGAGAPLLLLHGFPETGLMWERIVPLLIEHFTLVVVDLPGYGASACPDDSSDHFSMSKRALSQYLIEAMTALGFSSFCVSGHDRGGRVAYRMALDHPDIVSRIAVLDVLPTAEVWDRADARLALAFWPFSVLAQPAPLPERFLLSAPAAVIDDAMSNWGTPRDTFTAQARQAYIDALRNPNSAHSICEEYRAAATLDRDHDDASRRDRRKIAAPLLALWSVSGALNEWYVEAGGPLEIWRNWADVVEGRAIRGGHFFPEECPEETADLLLDFFRTC